MDEAQRVGADWVQRATRSNDARSRAAAQTALGDVNVALGNGEQARRLFEDSLAIRKQLVEREPGRSDFQRDLSISFHKLGDVNVALGSGEQARRSFEDSLAIRKQLVEREPSRSDLQRDLASSFERMATVDPEHGVEWFERSLAVRRAICATDPTNAVMKRDLAWLLDQLGTAKHDEVLQREALELLQDLRSRGTLPARDHAWPDRLAARLDT